MASNYNRGVADWKPEPPTTDNKNKLLSDNAQEKPAESNELKQFVGKSGKGSYGTLGRRGRDF